MKVSIFFFVVVFCAVANIYVANAFDASGQDLSKLNKKEILKLVGDFHKQAGAKEVNLSNAKLEGITRKMVFAVIDKLKGDNFSDRLGEIEKIDISNNKFLKLTLPSLFGLSGIVRMAISSIYGRSYIGLIRKLKRIKTFDLSNNMPNKWGGNEFYLLFLISGTLPTVETINMSGNNLSEKQKGVVNKAVNAINEMREKTLGEKAKKLTVTL